MNLAKTTKKQVMVTCYDATFARLLCDVDCLDYILVGDSLGMVIQGESSTRKVTVENIRHHTSAVRKGMSLSKSASLPILIADMPFGSCENAEQAITNARHLLAAGADAVKVEGYMDSVVRCLRREGIRVCAHVGLLPQTAETYKVRGRDPSEAEMIFEGALKLEEAGAEWIVLEMVPSSLAERISKAVKIPTIGIGAGPHCAGQVLVLYDLLGLNPQFRPKFLKVYLQGASLVENAVRAFAHDVRNGEFPLSEHSFSS